MLIVKLAKLAVVLSTFAREGFHGSQESETRATRELATLERTECLGPCPAYKVTVFEDGRVTYDGNNWVKVLNRKHARLDVEQMTLLRAAFEDAHFFSMRLDCGHDDDLPEVITWYRSGRRQRSIVHDDGAECAPRALRKLERRIAQLVHIERWIGTDAERDDMINRMFLRK